MVDASELAALDVETEPYSSGSIDHDVEGRSDSDGSIDMFEGMEVGEEDTRGAIAAADPGHDPALPLSAPTAARKASQRGTKRRAALVRKYRVGTARPIEAHRRLSVLTRDSQTGALARVAIPARTHTAKMTRQLQVTTFMVAQPTGTIGEARPEEQKHHDLAAAEIPQHESAEDDVEYIGTVMPVTLPDVIRNLGEWETLKGALGLLEIVPPGNDSCFYYGVYAMTYDTCAQIRTSDRRGTPYKEATYNRYELNRYIRNHLEEHVYLGHVDLEDLCQIVTSERTVTPEAVQELKAHLRRAGRQPCDRMVGYEYWAGEMEIKITAH